MVLVISLGVFFGQVCYADVIGPQVPFYDTPLTTEILYLFITLAVEMFFAWKIFFKENRKSLRIVFLANIISQPIAQLLVSYLLEVEHSIFLFFLVTIEVVVIFFEAVAYKFLLDGISFWKALKISLILNILSIIVGFLIFLLVLFVGMFLPNFAGRVYDARF